MDHLDLEEDQKEKLRQFTEFTHQHDYDMAACTLASLNWNLEQAIEAHLMQEEANGDDDDPEILETIQNVPRGTSHGATSSRAPLDVLDAESMVAQTRRRRGRVIDSDETGVVNNEIDDEQDNNGMSRNNERGAPIPRRGRGAAEPTSSASATSSGPAASRRRGNQQAPPPNQEPAHPIAARHQNNGTSMTSSSSSAAFRRRPPPPRGILASSNRNNHNQAADVVDIDDSDENDDDDDDMNVVYDAMDDDIDVIARIPARENSARPAVSNGRVPMIPEDYSSVPDALRNFATIFASRFCSTPATQAFMPPFYSDTLPNALSEAFDHPNTELRRPLVFYINHDRSIASNIFASQVLCSEAVSSLIRHQYILFPWDISTDSNLLKFTEMLQAANMADARNLIQRLAISKVESFPLMVIVIKQNSTYSALEYCKGTDTSEQVLEKLLAGVDEYSSIRIQEANAKREREERVAIRNQQEAEYKASLEADKARMAAKQREIDEQKAEEERKMREIEEEEMRRQMVASQLPDEPAADAPGIINVKFRLPEGGQDLRRFRRGEPIQTLVDYLSSKGFSPEKFKYFNSDFPKKELTKNFDLKLKFEDSKWPAREQIFVEEI